METDPSEAPGASVVARLLGAGRIAIGTGIWLAPTLSGRLLGVGRLDGGALALARVAATRDLVLGVAQIGTAASSEEVHRVALAGAAADAGDLVAFALALGAGERTAGRRGLAAATAATAAGAWLALKSKSK